MRLISRLLQLRGFDVVAVPDGGAALDALLGSFHASAASIGEAASAPRLDEQASLLHTTPPPPPPFDLAVLDMNMPVKSGPEAAAAFREWEVAARPGAARLPIIALTANVHEQVRATAVAHHYRLHPHAMPATHRFNRSTPPSAPPREWYALVCRAYCHNAGDMLMRCCCTQDLFLTKPLREEDVAVLRAHAASYREARAVEAAAAAEAEAAAARARVARDVLGMPLVAATLARGEAASPRAAALLPPPPPGKEPSGAPTSGCRGRTSEE